MFPKSLTFDFFYLLYSPLKSLLKSPDILSLLSHYLVLDVIRGLDTATNHFMDDKSLVMKGYITRSVHAIGIYACSFDLRDTLQKPSQREAPGEREEPREEEKYVTKEG